MIVSIAQFAQLTMFNEQTPAASLYLLILVCVFIHFPTCYDSNKNIYQHDLTLLTTHLLLLAFTHCITIRTVLFTTASLYQRNLA